MRKLHCVASGFEFYRKAARLELRSATWGVVLKLVLGGDRGATAALGRDDGQLGGELAAETLHVLYEVWLASKTREEALWASFVEYHRGWMHTSPRLWRSGRLLSGALRRRLWTGCTSSRARALWCVS